MIYIIGHKNPDTDSIVSAIAYAWFLKQQGWEVLSGRSGEINSETKFVLEKFGFETPVLIKNLNNKKVILVDHNEKEHQPEGIFEILEIWDHHRFNFSYPEPILIRCEPVGSTATLLAKEFFTQNVKISKEIAGLLISAILSDTIILKSPTTTEIDREVIQKLNEQWKFNLEEFGKEIKMTGMDLSLPIKELILRDLKEYNFSDTRASAKGQEETLVSSPTRAKRKVKKSAGHSLPKKIGVGQLELIAIEEFLQKKEEILREMKKIKQEKNYDSLILAVTDILKEGSELFVLGEEEKIEKAFRKKLQNNSFWVKGLMSRKKQIIPPLEKIFKS